MSRTRIGRAAISLVAAGLLAAGTAHAHPSDNLVLVPPAALPESARQGGEAMLLHDTIDGRTLLYLEQQAGTQLAVIDVTDPVHVKGEGAVRLDAPGPFEFVSPAGSQAVLVRFRQGDDAVLDLHKADAPTLKSVQGLTLRGASSPLDNDGFTVSGQAAELAAARDYQVVDTATSLGVKAAHPDKAVLSISGDGGFMFGVQELATAVQHGIHVVSVVFNNGAFGNVMRDQEERFGGRVIGAQLRNPDFMKLADSFGMAGYRVKTPAELRTSLEKAFAADAPALIEVQVERTREVSPSGLLMPPAQRDRR
jgi:hypothetical protein